VLASAPDHDIPSRHSLHASQAADGSELRGATIPKTADFGYCGL
jgi:hypothetical protein